MLVVYSALVYQVVLFANSQLFTRLSGHGGPCLVYSPHQDTPQHRAAREGHVDTVKCFVSKGADIDIKDEGRVSE